MPPSTIDGGENKPRNSVKFHEKAPGALAEDDGAVSLPRSRGKEANRNFLKVTPEVFCIEDGRHEEETLWLWFVFHTYKNNRVWLFFEFFVFHPTMSRVFEAGSLEPQTNQGLLFFSSNTTGLWWLHQSHSSRRGGINMHTLLYAHRSCTHASLNRIKNK